jgi:hypothetical protein
VWESDLSLPGDGGAAQLGVQVIASPWREDITLLATTQRSCNRADMRLLYRKVPWVQPVGWGRKIPSTELT